eukprot:CAMPEP_0175457508 /NCGR_PEP_ID=MMETSP0095-20121207/66102_1 /TAXON_ID=311494 /ORGANISM="Alexandrium monilatum, Strain CCMP3105" /LENGTH=79 /DNA_ID=CAMNT_0016758375 /DNA_START=24 /DNA_END=259 /DNA_ORIENTATION=-
MRLMTLAIDPPRSQGHASRQAPLAAHILVRHGGAGAGALRPHAPSAPPARSPLFSLASGVRSPGGAAQAALDGDPWGAL